MSVSAEQLRRRPRWVMPVLLALLGATIGGFVLYRQWTAVPMVFREADARLRAIPEAERAELARQIEMRLPSQYSHRIEPGTDGRRTLEATFEELNAWLSVRLEAYLENQGIGWPAGLGAVLVAEREGQLVVAADVDLPQLRQIVSVYFEVVAVSPAPEGESASPEGESASREGEGVAPEGGGGVGDVGPALAVRVDRITAGNVPLPRARLASLVREQLGESVAKPAVAAMLEALEEGRAVPVPRLRVDASRWGSVEGLAVSEGGVSAVVRMWRAGPEEGSGAGSE